jgi:ABC-type xylose transport system permease subunit
MNKKRQKTLMIIALVSIFLCGCPGCYTLFRGVTYFPAAMGTIQSFEDFMADLGAGFLNGGWMVCLSGFMILIPFVLVIIAVVQRSKNKDVMEELEPTGASEEDPIPPTS